MEMETSSKATLVYPFRSGSFETMAVFCHRCGGELAAAMGESTFCQHCGAPQLRVMEDDVVVKGPTHVVPGSESRTTSGQMVWGTAVGYAAGVAGVSALLMTGVFWLPAEFPIAWLWTVCGGVLVLALYQRRHPASQVNARMGVRVGLVYGLFAVSALSLTVAFAGVLARFGLHTMGTLDALLSNAMRRAAEQQAAQPGAVALSADQMRTFYSSEVRAGLALFLLTISAGFLMAFSIIGGALGGMMRMRRFGRAGSSGN